MNLIYLELPKIQQAHNLAMGNVRYLTESLMHAAGIESGPNQAPRSAIHLNN